MPAFPERHAEESAKAYDALCRYCELGAQRSLHKLRQSIGKSPAYIRQLERWSSAHDWQRRVLDYDRRAAQEHAAAVDSARYADIERLRRDALEDAHTLRTIGRSGAKLVLERLERLDSNAIESQHLSSLLGAISRILSAAIDLDAAALGVDAVLEHLDDDGDADENQSETSVRAVASDSSPSGR